MVLPELGAHPMITGSRLDGRLAFPALTPGP
jgi:hypothetical protein